MPKARSTCTRCSQRRQKCDRETPCRRCVKNNEAHLCTTEWRHGYDPNVHRKYPRKGTPTSHQDADSGADMPPPANGALPDVVIRSQEVAPHPQIQANRDQARELCLSNMTGQSQESTPAPANSLDFITFGRSDFTDISIASLLSSKDSYLRHKTLMDQTLGQTPGRSKQIELQSFVGGFSPAARAVEVYHMQTLLPSREQLLQLVDYHDRYMLYWSGGIYHAPSFQKSIRAAYGQSNELNLSNIDWRWTALLFSVISSSIIGSPESVSASWGYSNEEKLRLAKQWGNATIACLHMGDYALKYHIFSIQAILNMHCSEHLIGSTKEWAVYQSGAITIARGLNLHRLGPHPDDGKRALNEEQREALIQREIGRRVWYALVTQDWLCSTSQGHYSIQKKHFTTIRPSHFNDETMEPITDADSPAPTHVGNNLNDVAHMIIQYHDDMLSAPDMASKYNLVLNYDGKMRALGAQQTPASITKRTYLKPEWPKWVRWARRLHQSSIGHKLIMIHQAFLNRSFKSPQYTYSRWACGSAAKQVIESMALDRDPEEPQWWVEHAFVVTAGICLALDVFHRPEGDPEVRDYLAWVEKASKVLENWPNSSVAVHGIRLLSSLVQEYNKKVEATRPNPIPPATFSAFPQNIGPNILAESVQMPTPETEDGLPPEPWVMPPADIDMLGFEDLVDTLPFEASLDNNMFFESMLSLANSQFQ